jgi:hypothetical protein
MYNINININKSQALYNVRNGGVSVGQPRVVEYLFAGEHSGPGGPGAEQEREVQARRADEQQRVAQDRSGQAAAEGAVRDSPRAVGRDTQITIN